MAATMDEQHLSDLARILENRRRRGALLSNFDDGGGVKSSPSRTQFQPEVGRNPSPVRKESVPVYTGGPQVATMSVAPRPEPPGLVQSPPASAVSNAEWQAQVIRLQRELAQSRGEQEKGFAELKAGMAVLQEAVGVNGAGGVGGRAGSVRASSVRGQQGGMMTSVPRMVPAAGAFPSDYAAAAVGPRATPAPTRFDAAGRLSNPDPTPVDFDRRLGVSARGAAAARGGGGAWAASPGRPIASPIEPSNHHLPYQPREIPTSVVAAPSDKPYQTSRQLDVDSAVAILGRGDWFYKWSSRGTGDVSAKFVWLDRETYTLRWGKSQKSVGILSDPIKLETIFDVTTTVLTDHHDHGAKMLYILVVKAPNRVLRLGSEKRQKVDLWYEALIGVMSFYRMQGFFAKRHAGIGD